MNDLSKRHDGMSLKEVLLVVAMGLEKSSVPPWHQSQLIEAAWQLNKKLFGLELLYDRYPDSNKVMVNLMGEKGLTKTGFLEKVSPKKYKLTQKGRKAVCRLQEVEYLPPGRTSIDDDGAELLMRLFEWQRMTDAWIANRRNELSTTDAMEFYSPFQRSGWGGKLKAAETILSDVLSILEGVTLVLPNGRSVESKDVRDLLEMHEFLSKRFGGRLRQMDEDREKLLDGRRR